MILVAIVAVVAGVRAAYRHRRGLVELAGVVWAVRAWRRRRF